MNNKLVTIYPQKPIVIDILVRGIELYHELAEFAYYGEYNSEYTEGVLFDGASFRASILKNASASRGGPYYAELSDDANEAIRMIARHPLIWDAARINVRPLRSNEHEPN